MSVEGMPCCILSAADGLPVEASPLSFIDEFLDRYNEKPIFSCN